MRNDFDLLLAPDTPPSKICAVSKHLQKSLDKLTQNQFLENFSIDFNSAIKFLDDRSGGLVRNIWLTYWLRRIRLELYFEPSRRGNWKIWLEYWGETSQQLIEKINSFNDLKRKHNEVWFCDIGPINDLATFRRIAWPRYAKIYRQICNICLEIYPPDAE